MLLTRIIALTSLILTTEVTCEPLPHDDTALFTDTEIVPATEQLTTSPWTPTHSETPSTSTAFPHLLTRTTTARPSSSSAAPKKKDGWSKFFAILPKVLLYIVEIGAPIVFSVIVAYHIWRGITNYRRAAYSATLPKPTVWGFVLAICRGIRRLGHACFCAPPTVTLPRRHGPARIVELATEPVDFYNPVITPLPLPPPIQGVSRPPVAIIAGAPLPPPKPAVKPPTTLGNHPRNSHPARDGTEEHTPPPYKP